MLFLAPTGLVEWAMKAAMRAHETDPGYTRTQILAAIRHTLTVTATMFEEPLAPEMDAWMTEMGVPPDGGSCETSPPEAPGGTGLPGDAH